MATLHKSEEELTELAAENSTLWKDLALFSGCTMPTMFDQFRKDIEDLEVYDDDVWVTGFPRSGITWIQEMVWCISNDVNLEAAKQQEIQRRFPLLELSSRMANSKFLSAFVPNSINLVKDFKRPRFIKTYLPWELLPKQITTFERRPKIIHIARNPKDVCVSHYHFSRLVENYKGDFDLFWQLFLRSKLPCTPYASNILSYWKHNKEYNVSFIKYEDLHADLSAAINDMATFLDKNLSDDQVAKLLQHLNYDSMKNNSSVNYSSFVKYVKWLNFSMDKNGQFLRKGTVGDHSSLMSPEVIGMFDEEIEKVLQESGLEL